MDNHAKHSFMLHRATAHMAQLEQQPEAMQRLVNLSASAYSGVHTQPTIALQQAISELQAYIQESTNPDLVKTSQNIIALLSSILGQEVPTEAVPTAVPTAATNPSPVTGPESSPVTKPVMPNPNPRPVPTVEDVAGYLDTREPRIAALLIQNGLKNGGRK